ncbi:hypothetical protein PF008_g24878 [Phytophthora fragariae]|uniref:Uncharacterized protein n=1 Tax=Phytophthora fragariae TaxID=53985 RepID=A0A6G0QLM0_9STRA|nr:hypothetical protein PF008_g24878 [Phytophthora fragariae]
MADWIANVAMDTKRSMMAVLEDTDAQHELKAGILMHIEGDIRQWAATEEGR